MRSIILCSIACSMLVACATTNRPAPRAEATSITTTTQAVQAEEPRCEVFCEGAQVVATEEPDHHGQAVADANAVVSAMHQDLLACYEKRLKTDPTAHAFLTVDVVIGPDGHVWRVETTGGARLGKDGIACVANHFREATFAPVVGGGTRRVHLPLTFRRVAAGEEI